MIYTSVWLQKGQKTGLDETCVTKIFQEKSVKNLMNYGKKWSWFSHALSSANYIELKHLKHSITPIIKLFYQEWSFGSSYILKCTHVKHILQMNHWNLVVYCLPKIYLWRECFTVCSKSISIYFNIGFHYILRAVLKHFIWG